MVVVFGGGLGEGRCSGSVSMGLGVVLVMGWEVRWKKKGRKCSGGGGKISGGTKTMGGVVEEDWWSMGSPLGSYRV